MASTNKTPNYELSQFLLNDKLKMEDYNNDMLNIDAKTMPAAKYDPTGEVAEAGGILPAAKELFEDTLTETVDEAVAARGDGILTYEHHKEGTLHRLTNPNDGANIRFSANEVFEDGDTLEINGTTVDLYDAEGYPMGEGWKQGDTVFLLWEGNTATTMASYGPRNIRLKELWSGNAGGGNTIAVPGIQDVNVVYVVTNAGWIFGARVPGTNIFRCGGTNSQLQNNARFHSLDVTFTASADTVTIDNSWYIILTTSGNSLSNCTVKNIYAVLV